MVEDARGAWRGALRRTMVSQTETGDIGKPGKEKEKVGKIMEGKTRREKEEGKGTDLFVAMARGTNFGLWVTPSRQPRAFENPSGVAILHLAAVSLSRLIIMHPSWTIRPKCANSAEIDLLSNSASSEW